MKALIHDMERARDAVLGACDRVVGPGLINAMGLPYRPKEEDGRALVTPAKRFAHVLQGYEARMLMIATKLVSDDVVCLEHDGFVTRRRVSAFSIRRAIKRELGLRMKLEGGLVEPHAQPTPHKL